MGLSHGAIYLEVHPHLEEDNEIFRDEFTHVVNLVLAKTANMDVTLDWAALKRTLNTRSGMPSRIGVAQQNKLAALKLRSSQ